MPRLPLAFALAAALGIAGAGPAAAQEDVNKVNGSITANAGQAYGDLETVNGSIRIEAGARVESAQTVNGSIKVAERAQTRDLGTVNGGIRAEHGIQVDGHIETVNGEIFVDRGGRVTGGISTVNGSIGLVDTDLGKDIETVNGDITVGVGSHVRGGIKVEKPTSSWMPISFGKRRPPRIIIGPDAVVDGSLVFEREVKLYVHKTAKIGPVTGATAVPYEGERAPEE
ncbi:hypothetical protein M2650_14970 [Luteimonas sp. SX5]|uniref:Polymer-forming cytoskeletal protein n=1 Tax=Luteimonas galliterrae TaxID=2940486 RepID=A0ABT0MM06_9GAMM|nr:hypothetical protein [Luteimonas galliterrae]MCL1635925.1 hypothetical protein [Luteimonas galliterrae]